MGDSVAREHPVHRARLDPLVGAEAVAVVEPPAQEIGHGAEADMRMRPHIDPPPGQELRRAHLVEECEGYFTLVVSVT